MTGRSGRGGRRPGSPDTRGQILDAARAEFARAGFGGTTIRNVAAAASVDPALVHHYFGSKQELFTAVLDPPADPRQIVAPVLDLPPGEMGQVLVRQFLALWEGAPGHRARVLITSAVTDPEVGSLLREFVLMRAVHPVLAAVGTPRRERDLRAGLITSQLMGLAMARYVLAFPELTRPTADRLVRAVAPTIQRYLTGEI
jgi:AcrR family transcriptional regulator